MSNQFNDEQNTRFRLLRAAESLYVEHGYEAMSLRMITGLAEANPASVNYYFGSKEALMRELMIERLDRLNQERLHLLAACEQHYGKSAISATAVLGALIVPVLRTRRDSAEERVLIRLLLRAYGDSSSVIRDYLKQSHRSISLRFFKAFSHALPHLPRHELVTRVQLSLRALACVMADANIGELVAAICMGEPVNDSLVVTRLLVFVSPILTAPFGDQEQARQVEEVMGKVAVTEHVVDSRMHAGRARATEHKALRDDDLVMNCALFHSINDAIYPPLSSEMPVAAASALDEAADAGYPSVHRMEWLA